MRSALIGRARRLTARFSGRVRPPRAVAAEAQLPFFFYGTLKPGGVNYLRYRLAEATVDETPALLERAGLYTDGTYPFVAEPQDAGANDQVRGFVMTLAEDQYDRLLVELDDLEQYRPGAPLEQSWFVRRATTVLLATGERVEAWLYEAGPSVREQILAGRFTRITSGDWPIDSPPVQTTATSPAIPLVAPALPAGVLEQVASSALSAPPAALDIPYPSWRVLARWLLVGLALYASGWLLWNASPSLLPFMIGLVLAYLLSPIVGALDRRMPRWLAILIVYAGGIFVLIALINYIAPPVASQIQQLLDSIPSVDRLQQLGRSLLEQYQNRVPTAIKRPLEEGLRNGLGTLQSNVATYVQSVGAFIIGQVLQVLNTVTFLVGFLIIPIWLFFVLNDEAQGRAFIDSLLHPRLRADFWNVWGIINKVLSDYIRGQLILGLSVGVMVGLGLLLLGLLGFEIGNYTLLLALIAGLTELIPILGPTLGAIPGVLLGLFISPTTGLAVLLVYITVQQLENNLLVPRIIGESVGIHPAILTVVLIAMGHVFGLLGVILAAPLLAIARDLFIYTYRRLGGDSAAAARAALRAPKPPAPAKS